MNPRALDQQISEQLAQANIDRASRVSAHPSRAPAFALLPEIDEEQPYTATDVYAARQRYFRDIECKLLDPIIANVTREPTVEPFPPQHASTRPSQSQLLEAIGWALFAFLAVLGAMYGGAP